jgi:hypothetical protein
MVLFSAGPINFHVLQSVQIASRAHSAAYSTGNAGSFSGNKAAWCKSTTYPYLLSRLIMGGAMPALPTYFNCVHWDSFTFTPSYYLQAHTHIYRITIDQRTAVDDKCWADQETSRLLRNRKMH